ncbi:MAG: hypothetical protein K2N63_00820 [Lachnospiraceae bacterium]|nr:hypothetical protein [Lachnospiraceae bacterium]
MTKIYFIWKNINYSFLSEKHLTILILLGMVVCDVIFFIFGNVFWSDIKTRQYKEYENNIVTLEFDSLDISSFLERTAKKDFITSTFFEHTTSDQDNGSLTIAAYSPSFNITNSGIQLGSSLDGSPMEFVMNSSYARMRNYNGLPTLRLKDIFHFLDDDWIFAGILSLGAADQFDILINLEDFTSHIKEDINASFRYRSGTSLIEIRDFSNELQAEYHASHVVIPSQPAHTTYGEFLSDLGGALVLLVIAIINYMFLYQFLLTKRTYLYGIYKACGMGNFQTLCILCAELLVMLVISFGVAMLLYSAGLFLIGQEASYAQHTTEFLFAFLTIAAMNLFFGGIVAGKLIRNSPAKLIKESVVR